MNNMYYNYSKECAKIKHNYDNIYQKRVMTLRRKFVWE